MSTASAMRQRLAWVYTAALDQCGDAAGDGRAGGLTRQIRLQRIIQEFVDLSAEDPAFFLALAGLRDTGDPAAEHVVAVAVLSIAFGTSLGLDRRRLAELGLVALQVSIGRRSAEDPLAPDADLDPVLAVKALASRASLDAPALREAIVMCEHRWDHAALRGDGTVARRPHPMAQIIRLSSDFDRLTRGGGGSDGASVEEVVAQLKDWSGSRYHPSLLLGFLDTLGMGAGEPELADHTLPATRRAAPRRGDRVLGALKLKQLKQQPGA